MIPFLPARESAVASAALLALGFVATRVALPSIAKTRPARLVALALAAFVTCSHLAWEHGPTYPAQYWGATLSEILLCLLPLLVSSIPIAAAIRAAARWALRASTARAAPAPAQPSTSLTRRAVLSAATAFAPTVALATGASGFVQGTAPPRLPVIRFAFPDLAPALSGLRILQLSDLHLGIERHVEDLEALLDRLRDDPPDLVVFSGDVADDVKELDPALRAATRLGPRLGVYASLGNHEYLHGVASALEVYRRRSNDVRLLVGESERIRVGGVDLLIGGADDPVYTNADPTAFLARSIDDALASTSASSRAAAFRLLLCHRPEGFVPAEARGIDLVLAGHTHGGQIGFNGRSAFEPIWHDKYLWGRYARGRSQLYTTSGFGHWFPFRFMCPTEAPLIVLERA